MVGHRRGRVALGVAPALNVREPTRWELLWWGLLDLRERAGDAWAVLRGRARAVYPEEEEVRFWIGQN